MKKIEEIQNRPVSTDPSVIQPAKVKPDVNRRKQSKENIRKDIKFLNDGKAAGIPAEVIKAIINITSELLDKLVSCV